MCRSHHISKPSQLLIAASFYHRLKTLDISRKVMNTSNAHSLFPHRPEKKHRLRSARVSLFLARSSRRHNIFETSPARIQKRLLIKSRDRRGSQEFSVADTSLHWWDGEAASASLRMHACMMSVCECVEKKATRPAY